MSGEPIRMYGAGKIPDGRFSRQQLEAVHVLLLDFAKAHGIHGTTGLRDLQVILKSPSATAHPCEVHSVLGWKYECFEDLAVDPTWDLSEFSSTTVTDPAGEA